MGQMVLSKNKSKYYKKKYFIVFYAENDEDYVSSFDNIKDICKYKSWEVSQTNMQKIKNLLWSALHKENHQTRMLDGKLMHVYLIDIYDDENEKER